MLWIHVQTTELAENEHFQGFLSTNLLMCRDLGSFLWNYTQASTMVFILRLSHVFKILLAMIRTSISYSRSLHRLISLTYRPGTVARCLPDSARASISKVPSLHISSPFSPHKKNNCFQLLAESISFSFPALLVLYHASNYSARWFIRRSRG